MLPTSLTWGCVIWAYGMNKDTHVKAWWAQSIPLWPKWPKMTKKCCCATNIHVITCHNGLNAANIFNLRMRDMGIWNEQRHPCQSMMGSIYPIMTQMTYNDLKMLLCNTHTCHNISKWPSCCQHLLTWGCVMWAYGMNNDTHLKGWWAQSIPLWPKWPIMT